MTAHELLDSLQASGVELSLAPEGKLRCLAPRGVLTPDLAEALRLAKAELVALLTGPEPAPSPTRSYRQWVTGNVPQTATIPLAEPLPPATYHDIPTPCRTYIGDPCTKKVCKGHRTHFARSGLCTSCWERAKKTTTMKATPD